MRKAMLGLFLVVPLAWAGAAFSAEAPPARQQGIGGTVKVQANSVMRLPKRAQELRLRRVEIGEDAALLIPLEVSVLRIEELHMAKNARIGVAPGEERISIEVVSGRLADGSIISAPGATGTFRQSAGNGRDLTCACRRWRWKACCWTPAVASALQATMAWTGLPARPPAASGAAR